MDLLGTTNGAKEINASLIRSEDIAFQADMRYPSEYKKLKSYTLNWRTRLIFESCANPCMFITFTFDDENYNVDDLDDELRRGKLKKCFQDFSKRFRSNCKYAGIDTSRFKYYAITERGDDGRLHFHVLFFGFDYKSYPSKNKKGQRIMLVEFNEITDLITKSWGNGFVFFEAVCPENIKYVTKYLHKRRISGDYISLKSNGIGLSFLDDAKKNFFYTTDQQTFKIGRKTYFLPRYLKKKIWTDEEEYKAMNERLSKKIEEEERKQVENTQKSENRHYVICPESEQILRASCVVNDSQPTLMKVDSGQQYFLPEIKPLVEQALGFVYDPDDDSIQVYLCREEPDIVKWNRYRLRTNENFAMKFVYNVRM